MSILETLARHGPLKITHVMQKANLNCNVLKNYFDFLINQGAVEEKYLKGDKTVYAITERGLYLIKCFKELNQVIPTVRIRTEIPSTKAKKEPNWNELRINNSDKISRDKERGNGSEKNQENLRPQSRQT